MAVQSLANLQATVNRFANRADFDPIVIDGGMGSETENAVQNALVFAASQGFGEDLLAGMNTAFAAGTGQTFIMQHLADIQSTLDGVANTLSLQVAAVVTLKTPSTDPPGAIPKPNKNAIKATPPPGTSAFALAKFWFRQAPLWQQVGIGVAGGLAVLFGANAWHRKSSTKSAGTAGYRRY